MRVFFLKSTFLLSRLSSDKILQIRGLRDLLVEVAHYYQRARDEIILTDFKCRRCWEYVPFNQISFHS